MPNLYTDYVISNTCPSLPFNGGCPSSSCCCCCCCSFNCCSSTPINTVASSRLVRINPSPFYGFSQSILIQRPPSRRRMVLATGGASPICDLGPTRNADRNLSCIRDVSSDWIRYQAMKSKRKGIEFGGYGRMSVLKDSFAFHKVDSISDDAEAIISLLTDELCDERRKKKMSVSKKGTYRENVVDIDFKEFVKCKDSRFRKGETSGSSYYSSSDSGNSEFCVAKHKECTTGMRNDKELRKRVGSVAVREKVMEKLEKQRIKKNQYLECGRRDHDVEVGTSRRLDLRENSRKKLIKESVSDAHVSDSRKGYSTKKQCNYRVGSIYDVNSSDSSNKYVTETSGFVGDKKSTGYKASGSKASAVSAGEFCTACGQVTSGKEQLSKLIQCDNDRSISNSETQVAHRRKESSSLIQESSNDVHEQHRQERLVTSNQVNLRKSEDYSNRADAAESYEQYTNMSRTQSRFSENQNTGMRLNSTVRQDADTWMKRQEEASNLNCISFKEINDKSHQELHVATSQTELMRINQKRAEILDTSNSYAQDSSRAQQKQKHVVSVSSQIAKGESFQTGMQVEIQEQSRKSSNDLSDSLEVHFDEIMIADSSSASEERLYNEQSYLRERVKERHERVKETIKQTELRYEIQTPRRESNVTSTSQTRIEEIAEEEDKRNLPSGISPRLKPPPQSIEVTNEHVEIAKQPELRYEVEVPLREPRFVKELNRHLHVTSTSHVRIEKLGEEEEKRNLPCGPSQNLDPHPQSIELKETHENEMKTVKQTELGYVVQMPLRKASSVKETSKRPGITSASQVRIEEIGEEEDDISLPSGELSSPQRLVPPPQSTELHPVYFESASMFPSHDHDSHSSSGGESSIFMDPQSPDTSAHDDLLGPAESAIYVDSEHGKSRKESSSQLPGSVMGNETHDEQQPLEREQSENSETPKRGIVRRSGRVLWNVLAHIVRLQWGLHADARNNSTIKISGQSSLSDSVGSKAHDPVDAQGGSMETGTSRTSVESSSTYLSLLVRSPTQSLIEGHKDHDHVDAQGGSIETGTSRTPVEVSSTYQPLLVRTPTQSPIGPSFLSSSSGGVAGETNIELNVDMINWSRSDGRQLRRSHRRSDAIYELQGSGKEATGSGRVDQSKGDTDPSLNFASSSEEKEEEMRQGKLLRSNQVMKERFDEWQEAYRLESEQRMIDQTFMREAIEEAKKAADIWEVPVGAVLVQDGKIIARGHNLVEDLRDSTAHAEIICIRDASNFLKTWRLSETILYVTLEPCAMCAGAILQARIGTLVYGAPNKLLGADGSWVRLFPGSVDEEVSESTSKAEGPVHPFHSKMKIRRGILEAECGELMNQSFRRRKKKDNKTEEQTSKRETHHPSKLLNKMHHKFNFLFCL